MVRGPHLLWRFGEAEVWAAGSTGDEGYKHCKGERRRQYPWCVACHSVPDSFVDGSGIDVGFGTGECLVLLLSDPSVPRPSTLSGITDLGTHVQRTRGRIRKLQAHNRSASKVEVNLYTGDAVYRKSRPEGEESMAKDEKKDEDHPFHPSSPKIFDAILATDCAYHFDTRRRFLYQALTKLRPGGRIALADICFSSPTWTARALTWVIRMMPIHNRVSRDGYVQQMHDIGFEDVECEDITDEVFPHFIPFLKSQGWLWWIFAAVLQLYTSSGARFVVVSGQRPL